MPGKPLDFDVVRELAQALPDVEVITGPRGPSLKIGGKLLACPAINKSAEPDSLVVKIGFDQRASLIEEDPDVYYVTDHYLNYPSVLVRLSRIRRDSLRGLLRMASRFVGNKAGTGKQGRRKRVGGSEEVPD
jgi:hypothetical protein